MNDVKFLQGNYERFGNIETLSANTFYVATDKAVMAVGGQKYYGQPTIQYKENKIQLLGVSGETENPVVLGEVDLTLDSFLEGAVYVSGTNVTKVKINNIEVQLEDEDKAKLPGIVMLMHTEKGKNHEDDKHEVVIIPAKDFAGAVQTEIDAIETAVGLGENGTHTTTSGNYTSGATTIAGEIAALDAQLNDTAGKADTALQGVSATGDSFVSAEFTNNTDAQHQKLTVSTTIKEVSAATTSADGLAKASDVKAYVDTKVSDMAVSATGDTLVYAGVDATDNKKVVVSATTNLSNAVKNANTALQGIAKGTDGTYVTTRIGTKADDKTQTVGVSVTIQEVSSATGTAKGLAEASDVKTYVDNLVSGKNVSAEGDEYVSASASNNKVTVSASKTTIASLGKADTALQTVTATGDDYVTATFADKAKGATTQALTVSAKTHAIDSATADADGLATAYAVKQAVEGVKVTDVQYDSESKFIKLYNGTSTFGTGIDATAFIKDGMLEKAELVTSGGTGTGPWIKLTWNTDAGKSDPMYIDVASLVDTYTVKSGSEDYLAISGYTVEAKTHEIASATAEANGLATASDVKSYVDAQASASKTVVTGPTTGHVTVASAENADDKHMTYTITASDIQSESAYTEDKKTFLTGGTINGTPVTVETGASGASFASNFKGSDIELASSYTAPDYDEHFSATTVSAISADDKVDVAIKKLDNKVAALVKEVVDNEATVSSAINALAEATGTKGTDGVIAYKKSKNDIINSANNLSEADELLATSLDNAWTKIDALEVKTKGTLENGNVTTVSALDEATKKYHIDVNLNNDAETNEESGIALEAVNNKIKATLYWGTF